MEVCPQYPHNLNNKVYAALESLDSGELWDLALSIEMFDPTSQVLEHSQEVIYVDMNRSQDVNVVELVYESHYLRQVDQLRDLQTLLFEQSAGSPVAAEVANHGWPPLLKHELEEIHHLILQDKLLLHLCG